MRGDAPSRTMDKVVLDSSVTASWFLPDEQTPESDALYVAARKGEIKLFVPALWWWECGNIIRTNVMRGRLDAKTKDAALALLYQLPLHVEAAPSSTTHQKVMQLALIHQLSFYDASYLELAMTKQTLLATNDKALRRVAATLGVRCLAVS
jgi:predicted nucleic acid-binding protein